ncbi:Eukaryotic translation initiation factor eIF-1 [Aspergillus mulundensis]|nr:Eukaryotic translation initiation factor eIF-1 [Aspergillus mulundensis]RDW86153.1 Eukaryotic translation initiation factor eIF-1 [Aspergillus mulundensis]
MNASIASQSGDSLLGARNQLRKSAIKDDVQEGYAKARPRYAAAQISESLVLFLWMLVANVDDATAIPYVDPPKDKNDADMTGAMSSTMPMAAMFTRNRMIGWVAMVFSLQSWLGETEEQKKNATTPAYMSVGMSLMALAVTYLPIFLPPAGPKAGAVPTPSPTPAPPAIAITEIQISPPALFTRTAFKGRLRLKAEFMSIENLKTFDPFAEADEDTGETKQSQNYIHIRIQQRNGRKTLTTVQGLPKKFDQKKILKVIKKKFACNGTIVNDTEMGEVIQLQGDQRKDVQEFLTDKKEGLELDAKTIKVHGF